MLDINEIRKLSNNAFEKEVLEVTKGIKLAAKIGNSYSNSSINKFAMVFIAKELEKDGFVTIIRDYTGQMDRNYSTLTVSW